MRNMMNQMYINQQRQIREEIEERLNQSQAQTQERIQNETQQLARTLLQEIREEINNSQAQLQARMQADTRQLAEVIRHLRAELTNNHNNNQRNFRPEPVQNQQKFRLNFFRLKSSYSKEFYFFSRSACIYEHL